MAERWLWEPKVAGSSPATPRARSSAGQSKGFLIPRSGVRVPPGPFFFIHGWGFSSKVLKGVPSLDLPFHGKSILEYRGLWSLSRDLALRVREGAVLIGWSLGASLALMMAYLFPERFRGLVLIGASACFGCDWPSKNLRAFLLRLEKEGENFVREFRQMAYPKAFEDGLHMEGAKRMLKDYMSLDIRGIVPHIRQPVVLLHGLMDPIVPLSSAYTLHNLLKRSKLIIFPGGHFPRHEGLIFKVLKGMQHL